MNSTAEAHPAVWVGRSRAVDSQIGDHRKVYLVSLFLIVATSSMTLEILGLEVYATWIALIGVACILVLHAVLVRRERLAGIRVRDTTACRRF